MRTVFQIRGVTGAGKTTAMRNLLRTYGTPKAFRYATAHGQEEFTRSGKLVVVGNYNARANCVGCDRLKGRGHIFDAVDAMMGRSEELIGLESMIFSTTYKMSADLYKRCTQHGYEFKLVFLDCDFVTALERVHKRNGGKPISLTRLEHRIQSYETSRDKCLSAGIPSVRIDATRGANFVLQRVKEALLWTD